MGIFDPDEDEFGARLRDLHRLDELVGPPGAVRADQLAALEQIGEQGRLEVIEILGRLDGGQDPKSSAPAKTSSSSTRASKPASSI